LLAVPASAAGEPGAAGWRTDLRALSDALVQRHREPFRRVTRERFEREVADLDARIPDLASHQVILGMARIAALLGDGHTRLTLPEGPGWAVDYAHLPTPLPDDTTLRFHHLPIRLWAYEDGIAVTHVQPGLERHLGARLEAIEGAPADSALARMRPFVSHDNEQGLRLLGASRLTCVEALHAAGIAPRRDRVALVLRGRDGRAERVTLAPAPATPAPEWRGRARDPAGSPLADRAPERPWWFAEVPERDALFVQINVVANSDSLRLVEFTERLVGEIERRRPGRLVLDLRRNTGGDNQLLVPLVRALVRDRSLDRHGRMFVLIGRRTFSAAQMLVNHLEQWTEALFVGEPTGSTPSHFGDSRRVRLPESGLTLRISGVYWRDGTGNESRSATLPDLPAPMRIADALAGRDAALEAALDYRAPAGLLAQVEALHARGGAPAATRRILRAISDPAFSAAEVDSAIAALARLGERR
jgi:hypothetical protein